ncbi:hypothetical protein Q8G41_27250, partial [Klebsiella pneumoniae]
IPPRVRRSYSSLNAVRQLRLPPEIFIQDDGRGYGIDGGSRRRFSLRPAALFRAMEKPSLHFFEQTFCFPTRQPLINHFHQHAQLFPNTLREALG